MSTDLSETVSCPASAVEQPRSGARSGHQPPFWGLLRAALRGRTANGRTDRLGTSSISRRAGRQRASLTRDSSRPFGSERDFCTRSHQAPPWKFAAAGPSGPPRGCVRAATLCTARNLGGRLGGPRTARGGAPKPARWVQPGGQHTSVCSGQPWSNRTLLIRAATPRAPAVRQPRELGPLGQQSVSRTLCVGSV